MRNILATLEIEHDMLRQWLRRLDVADAAAGAHRKALIERIERILIPHARWEEVAFQPVLARRASAHALAHHADPVPHGRAIARVALAEPHASALANGAPACPAQGFSDSIMQCACARELARFATARALFSAHELAELDEQYEEWKSCHSAALIAAHLKAKALLASVLRAPGEVA